MFDWIIKEEIKAANAIILGDKTEGEGRPFKARFLQAGLVKYNFGVCLLKKETIDRFVNTFMECPVIIGHKDEIKRDEIKGTIKNIWFSPEDGWFWCSGNIDEEAANKVEKGFNVSCQYRITEYANNDDNKLHNGNRYDKEILNGVFEHLAIVENPRYEDAYIAVNAVERKEENVEEFNKEQDKDKNDTAQNSFLEQFKDMLYTTLAEGIVDRLGELIAQNEERWITIHPHGKSEDGGDGEGKDYRRLKIEDGETEEKLSKLTGIKEYKPTEKAKADKFFNAYCGKVYDDATEIMSMGIQRLFEEPKKFMEEDKEYFDFVIANLQGKI